MLASIDKAGRVVIPKEVRDRLSLQAGTEMELTIEGAALRLAPVRRPGRRVVTVDGWPVLESVRGLTVTDADVQRWREDGQR